MKSLFTILFALFLSSYTIGQVPKKESGILILSFVRDHMSFDLFVPGKIDLTKSLDNNLKHLSDTAVRFGLYEDNLFNDSILRKADTLTNESKFIKSDDDLKKVLVLAVEVEYEEDLVIYDLPDEFYSFDITFYDRNFLKIYNNKKPFFRKLRVLTLPK